ncbi:MAG: D-glycerate dehydrogenase [Parvibaculaceae bacterium]|nr:D-glycerate dehydrogenase [Parvibaculaceae bacterium]
MSNLQKPKLFITRKLPQAVEARAIESYHADLNLSDEIYSQKDLIDRLTRAETTPDALLVTVTDRIDRELIAALPASIRMIATFSVGYDQIDIKAASARGIAVSNTPDVLTDATADIALLLMLGAARGARGGEAAIRNAQWKNWAPTGYLGTHMTGKRLGIYGMGRIGRAVARRARAFDMEIHYHNRTRLPQSQEDGAIFHDNVQSLFSASDFLSLHAASTPETRNIINRESLSWLPEGAILINTARGDLVDDEALISALANTSLAAAGLDVFRNEPDIDPRYRALPNTFLLPHLGSATLETRNAMGFCALDNLDAFFAGQTPPNLIV